MTDRLWAALAIGVVLAIGFARLLWRRSRLHRRMNFGREYTARFQQYVSSGGRDMETYTWLMHRSNRMQSTMGSAGILAAFRMPFENFAYTNYAVVVNLLPQLRQVAEGGGITSHEHLFNQYAGALQEVLIRFDGLMEDRIAANTQKLINPLAWFREGMQLILLAPFSILESLGIGKGSLSARVAGNMVFRAFSAVATLVSLAASLVTILTGADTTATALRSIVDRCAP